MVYGMAMKRPLNLLKKVTQNGLALSVVGIVLVSGCVSTYALTRIEKPQSSASERLADRTNLSTTSSKAESLDVDDVQTDSQGQEESSTDSPRPTGDRAPASSGGSRQQYGSSEASVASTTALSLGGAGGQMYAYSNIQHAAGKPIDGPLTFSKTPAYTGARSVSFHGVVIKESDLTNSTQPEMIRTVVANQTLSESSGSATFYVFVSMVSNPLPISVTWGPMPSYSVSKTGQTRTDTGNAVEHTFSVQLHPNQSFGTPTITIASRGYLLDNCKAGSMMSVQTTYSGERNFTLRCIVPKPVCDRPPCPLISETVVYLDISAQTPVGGYIHGGASIEFIIPQPYEYAR